MQLGPAPVPPPASPDLAAALTAASRHLGHRPAVTVLRPNRRDEQGMASLAQWAAKGAHLLEADLLLEPGDRIRLDAPLSWTTAAVCLAAWWAGIAVSLDGRAGVAIVHEARPAPTGDTDVLWLGDDVDGSPLAEVDGEPWVRAVQAFPDQPPPPRAGPDLPALVTAARAWTHAAVLEAAAGLGDGTLGLDGAITDVATGTIAVTARPLVTGRPTVILDGVGRDAAWGERVATWY